MNDNVSVSAPLPAPPPRPAAKARLWELGIVGVVAALGLLMLGFRVGREAEVPSTVAYVAVVIAGISVAVRRWNPVAVLVVVAFCRVLVNFDSGSEFAVAPAMAVAMYAVGRSGDRRTATLAAGAVAVVTGALIAALDDDPFVVEFIGETAQYLLPAVIGDAVRARADRLAELIETETETRVHAERLRIARDLHDVVAHGLSTIAVQSGVAAHLIDRNPEEAKASLEIINRTGKESLEELRAMVGVLRSTDDAPRRPAPTEPDAFSELLAGAEASGIELTDNSTGVFPDEVGDGIVVAVHRIVQEALTNVVRHAGPVPTTVTVDRGDDEVTVSIVNRPGRGHDQNQLSTVPSTGVGLIGMRERAESLGGTCTAGPTAEGGFEVRAVIPYRLSGRRS